MRQTDKTVSPMSNEGRNLYVVEHITDALLRLMKQKQIHDISIGELCDTAGVGRASFYRNFESKEDVIARELKKQLDTWWRSAVTEPDFNFASALFGHYYKNRDLYMLLYRQGLSHLTLQSIKDACGPKPEHSNIEAYTASFISYGLYGWVEEWFHRGMPETPEQMAKLWADAQNQTL